MEFGRLLGIALSSSSELEYHLILARDTHIIPEREFVSLVSQTITVRKMLYALLKRVATPEPVQSANEPKPAAPSRPAQSP